MALINCPDCGKKISDQARTCLFCGLPVAARLQQMREEEEAIRQQIEKRREIQQTILIAAGVILFFLVASCISNSQQSQTAPTEKVLYEIDTQSSITPGTNTFEASGKLKLEYTCQSNAQSTTNVQLTLVDMHSPSTVVWKKSVTCPVQPFSGSETLEVKTDSYDIGSLVSGDATWSMTITQM